MMDSVVDADSFFFYIYQLSMSLNEATEIKASFKTENFFLTQFTSCLALKYHKSRPTCFFLVCFFWYQLGQGSKRAGCVEVTGNTDWRRVDLSYNSLCYRHDKYFVRPGWSLPPSSICRCSSAPTTPRRRVKSLWSLLHDCKGVWKRHQGRISWPWSQHYSG